MEIRERLLVAAYNNLTEATAWAMPHDTWAAKFLKKDIDKLRDEVNALIADSVDNDSVTELQAMTVLAYAAYLHGKSVMLRGE